MVDRLSGAGRGLPPPESTGPSLRSDSMYSNPGNALPDPGGATKEAGSLDDFYSRVTEVQNGIKDVKNMTQKMQQLYGQYLQSANKEETQKLSDNLEQHSEDVSKISQKTKDILKRMSEEIQDMKEKHEASRVAELRIMENQHGFLLKQFVETMKIYHNVQAENEKKYKEQVVRRLKTKFTNDDGSTISEARANEMANELLQNGASDQIFQQSKHKLESIIETRNEVVKIEKAIRELAQLFTDLASLVQEQGELLNDISHNMRTTNQYMEKGISELKKAKTYSKKSRKKMIYLICCILIVIAGITVPVTAMQLTKK